MANSDRERHEHQRDVLSQQRFDEYDTRLAIRCLCLFLPLIDHPRNPPMNYFRQPTGFCSALVLLVLLLPQISAGEPKRDHCVVLISVDGLAHFYLDDPRAEMPTIRRLAAEGARAEGMIGSFPTVTWPNHTTLVTGVAPAKHGVIGNNYLDRQTGKPVPFIPDPLFDKDEIVKVPTIYDAAAQAGLVTAGVIWPASRNAKTLHYTVPDMAGDDAWPRYGTPSWMEELRAAGIPIDKHGTWVKEPAGGVQRDWLYTRLAAHVLKHHPPNLLLVHLIELDHVQHKFGPRSDDAYWAVSQADDRVRDIVEATKLSPYADKTTIIVASDHGFFPIEKDIRLNVLAKQIAPGTEEQPAIRCVSQGGGCMVYVLDDAHKADLIAKLKDAIPTVDGVAGVFTAEQFAQLGQELPGAGKNAPDLWVAAKSGYSFSDTATGDDVVAPRASRAGTHGYLPDQPDMLATCVIGGAQIQPHVSLGKISNEDVAPTIAGLLSIDLPTADGKILTKAFAHP